MSKAPIQKFADFVSKCSFSINLFLCYIIWRVFWNLTASFFPSRKHMHIRLLG
jgi:hypothetical protein